jgi:AraC-like DNA-binding protein
MIQGYEVRQFKPLAGRPKARISKAGSKIQMPDQKRTKNKILAVDCCEHTISALENVLETELTSVSSGDSLDKLNGHNSIDLIVVGTSDMPVRRFFISRLRRFYPETPMLVLRRERKDHITDAEWLRGEFLLSDKRNQHDLEIVRAAREALPMEMCEHTQSSEAYELVRDVTRVLAQNFSQPDLDLEQVADELSVSPTKLSRLLNRHVRVSFRQLLRHIRIEEAKRLLASQRFSVKEVAARVGFSDSHYFSRIFKETTGTNPTEFEVGPQELILN